MQLKPCRHCRFKADCEVREKIRAGMSLKLRGVRFSSLNFVCRKRSEGITAGARVSLEVCEYEQSGGSVENWPDWEPNELEVTGTVMKHEKGKVMVWLDEPIKRAFTQDRDNVKTERLKVWPERLTALGESVEVCSECGRPDGKENREEWFCMKCNPMGVDL